MIESWRWYGGLDAISLDEVAQTGATGIVTALHEIPYGEVWPSEEIAARKAKIESAGFTWEVVESLPVHEHIKRGIGDLESLFEAYKASLANLAENGINVVCYNFMPLLDWTRTDLNAPVTGGGTCLRYDATAMAAFDIHMLQRPGAAEGLSDDLVTRAGDWFAKASDDDQATLLSSIMSGIPGAFDRYDIEGLRNALQGYAQINHEVLRRNYLRFLEAVVPTAERLGMQLCVHPDDPPRDILGLPRIVSSGADIAWIMRAVDSPANGLTLCSGSLGAGVDNDVPAIAAQFADRIAFAHLRNVRKEPDGSFEEAAHLEGDTDLVALIRVLLDEETRRANEGQAQPQIPFRPDHGHVLLSDIGRTLVPGYPLIGRLRGLAELRGAIAGVRLASH